MYLTFDIVNTNDFYSVSSVKQLGFLFLSSQASYCSPSLALNIAKRETLWAIPLKLFIS